MIQSFESARNIVGGDIPEANAPINECLLESRKICSSPNEINIMKKFLTHHSLIDSGKTDNKNPGSGRTDDRAIISALKKYLDVDTEARVWEHTKFKAYIGSNKAEAILKFNFKPTGPSDSTALLDNFNIDNTLEQWSVRGIELFKKKFYHIPFQMIDFAKVNSQLARTDLASLLAQKYDCFGVVLNTDVSTGGGKHWFCMYGDFQHKGTLEDPYTLEYFNSSGNPPMDEVSVWMQKVIFDLVRDTGKTCVIVRSMHKRVQESHTECGIWSLMYIKSRLQGHAFDWFYTVKADDADMIKLRKHLFRKK